MTYIGILNFQKMFDWKLSSSASFLMCAFADLESWAVRYKSEDKESDDIYYLLYRKKILKDLPVLGSVSSVSRGIRELEDKGIIKSINKHSTPAYCLTVKGLEWKRRVEATDQTPPPEESKDAEKPPNKKPKTVKKGFSLERSTTVDNLNSEYYQKLRDKCLSICVEKHIDKEEFDKFIDWHSSKGNGYKNWLSAFRNWSRNCKKYSGDESANDDGLWQ